MGLDRGGDGPAAEKPLRVSGPRSTPRARVGCGCPGVWKAELTEQQLGLGAPGRVLKRGAEARGNVCAACLGGMCTCRVNSLKAVFGM